MEKCDLNRMADFIYEYTTDYEFYAKRCVTKDTRALYIGFMVELDVTLLGKG